MIKNAIAEDDCALRNPRRNQYRRNTHPQAVKLKTKHRIGRKFIRGASGWRHVVVNSTMLVVNNQQRTALPELLIGSDRLYTALMKPSPTWTFPSGCWADSYAMPSSTS